MQFLGKLSCLLCIDSARVETVQITVGVPQLQISWVLQFSDKVVYMPAVVYFFDKVVEVPVVLCNGVPQELGSSTGDVSGYSGDGTAPCAHLCLAPLGRKSSMRKWQNCTFKYSVRSFGLHVDFGRVSPSAGFTRHKKSRAEGSSKSSEVRGAGGHLAQKSELSSHQMAQMCDLPV